MDKKSQYINSWVIKIIASLIWFLIIDGLIVTKLKAQDINSEIKNRLRNSIVEHEYQLKTQSFEDTNLHRDENNTVLKISPLTKLPSKMNRFGLLNPHYSSQ